MTSPFHLVKQLNGSRSVIMQLLCNYLTYPLYKHITCCLCIQEHWTTLAVSTLIFFVNEMAIVLLFFSCLPFQSSVACETREEVDGTKEKHRYVWEMKGPISYWTHFACKCQYSSEQTTKKNQQRNFVPLEKKRLISKKQQP